jgi:hypothetical protein
MTDFFFTPELYPFTLSIAVMFVLFFVELIGLFLGGSLSHFFDNIFPDWHVHHSLDMDGHEGGPVSYLLSWLRIKKVPLLVVLIIFLTYFGLTGILLQSLMAQMLGILLQWFISVPIALVATLFMIRLTIRQISKCLPKDETDAVAQESFIGLIATITLGEAKTGCPAEAKLKDKFSKTHYIMIEPEDNRTYTTGDKLLIVKRRDAIFIGIGHFPDTLV